MESTHDRWLVLTVSSLFSVNVGLLILWLAGAAPGLSAEDGVLETLQVLLAVSAASVFVFVAFEGKGPVASSATALAAIAIIATMREIDVRRIVVPDWMMIWANSPFRDTTVAVLLLLVLVYLWFRREDFGGWSSMLLSPSAWPLWLSGILLTSSLTLDGGKVISGELGVVVEEFVELNGFMLLLIAAWRHCRLLTQRSEHA
ncbi:MAG: hypothetical protein JXQ99_23850 [Hyphomicrobiaceae bacterium]